MSPCEAALKRAFDIAVAAGALVTLSPLLATVAAAVRLDSPGPTIFRQARTGQGGRVFALWKFRTMNETAKVKLDGDGRVMNAPADPRHTRVGRLLRRTSLDELPQLVNVLMGDMSIVGPRPDVPDVLNKYTQEQSRRFDVKPGITGLAQVEMRNNCEPGQKWDLDARYARDGSLLMDGWILLRTVRTVLAAQEVYRG